MSSLLLGAAMLGLLSCSKPVLEGARLDALADVASQVDGDRLMGLVSELVDTHKNDTPFECTFLSEWQREEFGNPLCHLTRQKAGEQIQARFEELGLRVRRQETAGSPFSSSNIVAELPGTTKPEEVVLVGAHYDAFHAGADDNTTGVAAVLELARVLSHYKFERTVRFVGFDFEEYGLVGSSHYVDAKGGASERLVATLIFDGIGYYDSRPGSQTSLPGLPTPSAGDFLAVIGNDISSHRASEVYALNNALKFMKVTPLIAPRDGTGPLTGNLMRSDHTPFWVTQQEALFFTDTANFRNPHYHQDTDTIGTLEPTLYRQAVRLSAATLAFWAGGPQP
ncbi:M28 family peptidase [Archangium violaceum]|uniref:M28 family peptidase n=1 Tax=Archangium violaceum TaxID=83451 RepID=UPI0036D9AB70